LRACDSSHEGGTLSNSAARLASMSDVIARGRSRSAPPQRGDLACRIARFGALPFPQGGERHRVAHETRPPRAGHQRLAASATAETRRHVPPDPCSIRSPIRSSDAPDSRRRFGLVEPRIPLLQFPTTPPPHRENLGEWLGTVRRGFRNYNKQMQRGQPGTDRARVRGHGEDGRQTRTRTTRTTARSNDKGSASRDEGGARRHGGIDGCVVKADGLRGSKPGTARSRANVSRSSGWEMESGEQRAALRLNGNDLVGLRCGRRPVRTPVSTAVRTPVRTPVGAHARGCARPWVRTCAHLWVRPRVRTGVRTCRRCRTSPREGSVS
jgi:hypothetical protein